MYDIVPTTMIDTTSRQHGFAPLLVLVGVFAAVSIATAGTVVVADKSNPGDPLFGLDKALEELEVRLADNEHTQAKARLTIAKERLLELAAVAESNRSTDAAVDETRSAVTTATTTVGNIAVQFKENKIQLVSSDVQALLTELQNILETHQGLIRRVKVKITDGQIEAKIKLIEQETEELDELVEEDLNDLEDDGQLNASTTTQVKVKLKGTLAKTDSTFQITLGNRTFTLTPSDTAQHLDTLVGQQVEVEGVAQQSAPTAITVISVSVKDHEEEAAAQPEAAARGTIERSGNLFVLTSEGNKPIYTLSSPSIDLTSFLGKFVKVEGPVTGTMLTVKTVELRDASAPALSSSIRIRNEINIRVDEADDVRVRTRIENNTSGSSNGDEDDDNDHSGGG